MPTVIWYALHNTRFATTSRTPREDATCEPQRGIRRAGGGRINTCVLRSPLPCGRCIAYSTQGVSIFIRYARCGVQRTTSRIHRTSPCIITASGKPTEARAMQPDYSPIPTSALIALAHLILKKARLSLRATTRDQAIAVIRGIKSAPSRSLPFNVKTRVVECYRCHKPIPSGTLCEQFGRAHINCKEAA